MSISDSECCTGAPRAVSRPDGAVIRARIPIEMMAAIDRLAASGRYLGRGEIVRDAVRRLLAVEESQR
jgi:Arc/MetJ-type ribon-helix-helix transcriptional regulator